MSKKRNAKNEAAKVVLIFHTFFLVLLFLALPIDAYARDVDLVKGVKATVNSLKYVRGLSDGNKLSIAVLYNSGSNASQTEAKQVVRAIKNMHTVPRIGTVAPVLISINNINQAADFDVLYLVRGLSDYYDKIGRFSRKHNIFSISLEESCARNGSCAVSIKLGRGAVEIFLNETAMRSTGYEVDAAFRYMARRVSGGNK